MLLEGAKTVFKPAWKWGFNQAGLKCDSSDYLLQPGGSYQHISKGDGDIFGSQDDGVTPGLIFIRFNSKEADPIKGQIDVVRLIVISKDTGDDEDYYSVYGYGIEADDEDTARDPNIDVVIKEKIGEYYLEGSPASFCFDDAKELIAEQNLYFYLYGQTVTKTKVIQESSSEIFDAWKNELLVITAVDNSVISLELDELIKNEQAHQDKLAQMQATQQLEQREKEVQQAEQEAREREKEKFEASAAALQEDTADDFDFDFDEQAIDSFLESYLAKNTLLVQLQGLVVHVNTILEGESPFPEGALGAVSMHVANFFAILIRVNRYVDTKRKEGRLTLEELQDTIDAHEREPQEDVLELVTKQLSGLIEAFHADGSIQKWMDYLRYKIIVSIESIVPTDLEVGSEQHKPDKAYKKFDAKTIASLVEFSKSLGDVMRDFEVPNGELIVRLNRLDQLLSQTLFLSELSDNVTNWIRFYENQFARDLSQLARQAVNSDEKLYELMQRIILELDTSGADHFHHQALDFYEERSARELLEKSWCELPDSMRNCDMLRQVLKKAIQEFNEKRSPLRLYTKILQEEKHMKRRLDQYQQALIEAHAAVAFVALPDAPVGDAQRFASKELADLLEQKLEIVGKKDIVPSLYIAFISSTDECEQPKIVVLAQDKDDLNKFHAFGVGLDINDGWNVLAGLVQRRYPSAHLGDKKSYLTSGCTYDEAAFIRAVVNEYCDCDGSVDKRWMKIFSQGVEAASSSEQLSQARHDLVKLNKQLELVSEEAQRLQEENVNLLESITTLTKQNRTLQADLSKTKRQSILMVDGSQVETAKGLQQQHAKEMEVLQKQITALTSLLDDLGEDATKAAAMRGQLAGLTTAMQDMREQNEELERVLLVREKELSKLTTLYNKSDSLAEQNAILQDELDVMQEKLRGMTDGKRDVLSTQPGVSIADELDQVARHKVGAELAAGKVFAKQAAEAFELSKVMQLCQNLSHVYASLQGQFLEGMTAELDQLRTKGLTETAQAHRAQGLVSHWLKKPVNIDHSKIEQRIVELEKKDSEFRGCMVQLTEAIHGCLSMFNKFMSRLTMPSESAVRASHIQNRDEVVEKLQNLLNLQMQNIVKILQTVMPESKQRRLALRRDLLSKMLGQVFGKARTCNAPEVEEKETLEGGLAKFVLRTLSLTEEQDSMMQPSAQAVYNLCNKLLVHITDIKNTRFNSTTVGLLCADFSENLQQVIATALYASGSKYDDWREERLVLCDDSIRKIESLLEEKSKNRKEPFKGRAVTNTSNAAAQAYAAVSREGREVNSRETDTIAIPSQVAGIFNVVLMWVMHILTLEQKPLAPQAYQEINTLVGRFVDAYNCQLAVIHHAHYVDIEPGNMKSMTDEQAQAYLVKLSEVKELRDAGRAKAHEEYHQLFTDVLSQLKPLINVILQGGDAANIIIQLKEILESGLEKMQSAVLQAQELRAGEIERVQAMLYERNESSAATTQSLFGGHLVRSQGSEASKEVARHTVTASGSAT